MIEIDEILYRAVAVVHDVVVVPVAVRPPDLFRSHLEQDYGMRKGSVLILCLSEYQLGARLAAFADRQEIRPVEAQSVVVLFPERSAENASDQIAPASAETSASGQFSIALPRSLNVVHIRGLSRTRLIQVFPGIIMIPQHEGSMVKIVLLYAIALVSTIAVFFGLAGNESVGLFFKRNQL